MILAIVLDVSEVYLEGFKVFNMASRETKLCRSKWTARS